MPRKIKYILENGHNSYFHDIKAHKSSINTIT